MSVTFKILCRVLLLLLPSPPRPPSQSVSLCVTKLFLLFKCHLKVSLKTTISLSLLSISRPQVITTCGPRKPQRSSWTGNSSAAEDDIAVLHQFPSPVHNCLTSATSPQQNHKLHLETSFAPSNGSGQYPRPYHEGETNSYSSSPGGGGGGGHRGISLGDPSISEATTVPLDELKAANRKNVVFDTKREIITESTKSKRKLIISPPLQAVPPRGILQTSNNSAEAMDRKRAKKPMSLSFTEVRSTRTISEDSSNRKVDLIHDDWFGLAPLASPESLSEISSISSRATSLGKLNLNSSIERVFHMASCQEEVVMVTTKKTQKTVTDYGADDDDDDGDDDLLLDEEDKMRTPVIMRRAIKIDTELSRCGDNWAEVEKYKRHGKVFVSKIVEDGNLVDDDTDSSEYGRPSLVGAFSVSRPNAQRVNQLIPNGGRKPFVEISCSSDSSSCASSLAGSFRTAQNDGDNVLLIDFNSKSTECLDSARGEENRRKLNASEELLGGRGGGGGDEGRTVPRREEVSRGVMGRQTLKVMDAGSRKMAQSDSAILGDSQTRTGVALKRIDAMRQESAKVTIMNSSSDTYHSATSSYSSSGFFKQEPITNKMASGVIESHFPVVFDLPPPTAAAATGSPLRSQVLIKSTERRLEGSPLRIRQSASNSPAKGPPRIPTVTIQYPQKSSPTHFNKGRKIYPAASTNTSKSNSFGAEESNV